MFFCRFPFLIDKKKGISMYESGKQARLSLLFLQMVSDCPVLRQ